MDGWMDGWMSVVQKKGDMCVNQGRKEGKEGLIFVVAVVFMCVVSKKRKLGGTDHQNCEDSEIRKEEEMPSR